MILAKQRIGPHNIDILSIFYGTLLGDSSLEMRFNNVRLSFQQESINCEYLIWLWSYLSKRNYCSSNKPKLLWRLGKYGKKRYYYRLNSYTFSSLNFLYDEFYYGDLNKKRVPLNILNNLTPLAFACWIMDDGGLVGSGLKLSNQNFIKNDLYILQSALYLKWGISTSLHKTGVLNQYIIYIPKSEISKVQSIVKPFIVKSMFYKIHLI